MEYPFKKLEGFQERFVLGDKPVAKAPEKIVEKDRRFNPAAQVSVFGRFLGKSLTEGVALPGWASQDGGKSFEKRIKSKDDAQKLIKKLKLVNKDGGTLYPNSNETIILSDDSKFNKRPDYTIWCHGEALMNQVEDILSPSNTPPKGTSEVFADCRELKQPLAEEVVMFDVEPSQLPMITARLNAAGVLTYPVPDAARPDGNQSLKLVVVNVSDKEKAKKILDVASADFDSSVSAQ